ncbi:transposase [Streptomyces sp. NPDC085927]|uniref:transposase n=1 Tax=Streptomyces sp. NPDC085927 TaxID=3365738 RepID=UPI0037D56D11
MKNRGVRDVLMLVCDGLSALPDAVNTVWPQTVVQTCVVHLIRASLRYASRRDWAEIARDLKPVYTAVNEEEARQRLADFDATWGKRYPSIAGTWQRAWSEFMPFLGLPQDTSAPRGVSVPRATPRPFDACRHRLLAPRAGKRRAGVQRCPRWTLHPVVARCAQKPRQHSGGASSSHALSHKSHQLCGLPRTVRP